LIETIRHPTAAPAIGAGARDVWARALRYHWDGRRRLVYLLPALCVPFLSDVLHSVLIAREARDGTLDPRGALREALRALPSLVRMKLAVELRAMAWSFVPIYGMIQGVRHRVAWAMASNVLVFEGLRGGAGCERCLGIADGPHAGLATRTLVVAPSVAMVALMLVWAVLATWVEREYSYTTWIVFAAVLYFLVPGSAAANSFLYMEIAARERASDPTDRATPASIAAANLG
jgi:hypothetical protein